MAKVETQVVRSPQPQKWWKSRSFDVIQLIVFTGALVWLTLRGANSMNYVWQWHRIPQYLYRIIDGEFIPVEQKTGKVPKRPHASHRMQILAYLHLVEVSTKKPSPYGVLRYGKENLHQIEWDSSARKDLFSAISEVQRLMVEGGARRNHERPGKCENCSRRYACSESLV